VFKNEDRDTILFFFELKYKFTHKTVVKNIKIVNKKKKKKKKKKKYTVQTDTLYERLMRSYLWGGIS